MDINVPEKKTSDMPMSSSLSKTVSNLWVCATEKGGRPGRRGEASRLWETEQSIFNMGPERSEVCNLHCWPQPLMRDYAFFCT